MIALSASTMILGLFVSGLLYFVYRYQFLIPAGDGIPILMYHHISTKRVDKTTVHVKEFEKHLIHILQNKYSPLLLSELADGIERENLPDKPIVLTFDDGYLSFIKHAIPLLRKYDMKSVNFVPIKYIGQENVWDGGQEKLMGLTELKNIPGDLVELGLHSFEHVNYATLSEDKIEKDLQNCIDEMQGLKIPYFKALAYPYGAYPKEKNRYAKLTSLLKKKGIKLSLRIGNRLNKLPIKDPYLLTRIDIHGNDSFTEFKIKLKKGRCRLF